MDKAIFFDKDGTLITNVPFNVDPARIEFSRGATLALSSLKSMYQFHIVTNQAGIAFGHFPEEALAGVRKKIGSMFNEVGAVLTDFHYCPHHPQGKIPEYARSCLCRKPGSLMLEQAAHKYQLDLKKSWMIGDILDDIECGKKAGCRTILLDIGNETEWILNAGREPDYKVQDLEEAAFIILNEE